MNKNQIKDLLSKSYKRNEFVTLLTSIFNEISIYKSTNEIFTNDESIVSFSEIGNIKLSDNKNLSIFEMITQKNINIYKNKVKLRNIASKFIDLVTNHGFLLIIDNQTENYRLTFTYKSSELIDGKIIEKETDNKRFSYLLGESESCSTPAERLDILSSKKKHTAEDLIEAFNVDKVTYEFFEDYKQLYNKLVKNLESLKRKDDEISRNFIECEINEKTFAKKVLGQLVSIYFIQKKGLLGIKKLPNGSFSKYGSGPKNFIRKLFNKEYCEYENFYNDVLEPFFYEALSTLRDNDYYSPFDCKIPFLNGGLFEKFYGWEITDLKLDNNLFAEILDTFDRYNFTIQEYDPSDNEIAIDPEMLGKVFEMLNENKDVQYTPRPVVSLMCNISIFNYLKSKLAKSVSKNIIDQIMITSREYYLTGNLDCSGFDKENMYFFEIIDNALKDILICDPAIGSGEFPVEIMNVVCNIRFFISKIINKKTSMYDLKYNFIKDSIHGVDIDEGAVEIAKLRLWLSLIIEEDNPEKINVLPNLSYKIVTGDSLIQSFEGFIFKPTSDDPEQFELGSDNKTRQKLFTELINLQKDYFQAKYKNKKDRLNNDIINLMKLILEDKLHNSFIEKDSLEVISENFSQSLTKKRFSKFFPWKLYFASIFPDTKSGFDIVIGNPPYIESRSKDFNSIKKTSYLNELNYSFPSYQIKNNKYKINPGSDLCVYFFPLAIDILKNNGINCYISTNAWLSTNYGRNLQYFLTKHSKVLKLIDSDIKYFRKVKNVKEPPDINTVISLIEKNDINDEHKIDCVTLKKEASLIKSFDIEQESNIKLKTIDTKNNKYSWGMIFNTDEWILQIFNSTLFGHSDVPYKIQQGLNITKNFIIDSEKLNELNIEKTKLIPFVAKEHMYSCSKTSNFLIDKNKCSKQEIEYLGENDIKAWDPNSIKNQVANFILPRGISEKHYCVLNKINARSDSAVEVVLQNNLNNSESITYNLWAFLNSSLFFLYRECSGRLNLGGGLLKSESIDIKQIMLPYNYCNVNKIKVYYEYFKDKEVDVFHKTIEDEMFIKFDNLVMKSLGIENQKFDKIREALLMKIALRFEKALN